MLVYCHHTGGDVIDLDEVSGTWFSVDMRDHVAAGRLAVWERCKHPVAGSYTIEDGKRYALFWNGAGELVFLTPDNARYVLFQHVGGGRFEDRMDGIKFELREINMAGQRDGCSEFRLVGPRAQLLHRMTYFALRYRVLYMSDFTFSSNRHLSDWDFFVALIRAVDELKRRSAEASAMLPAP